MREAQRRILGDRSGLQVLERYVFGRPDPAPDAVSAIDAYRDERPGILFDHICPGRDEVEFELVLCRSCGLLFTNPCFTEAEVAARYRAVEAIESAPGRPAQHRGSARQLGLLPAPGPGPTRAGDLDGARLLAQAGLVVRSVVLHVDACE